MKQDPNERILSTAEKAEEKLLNLSNKNLNGTKPYPRHIINLIDKILEKEELLIRNEIVEMKKSLQDNESGEEFNGYREDGFSGGTYTQDVQILAAEFERGCNYLNKVKIRRKEIERNKFTGLCSICEHKIPIGRLVAVPVTKKCCRCKNGEKK